MLHRTIKSAVRLEARPSIEGN